MPRLNIFENIPIIQIASNASDEFLGANSLHIHHVNFPGSISFKSIGMLFSGAAANQTMGVSIGLYSLNGASLSLANSVALSTTVAGFTKSHYIQSGGITISNTSYDITPGDWWFAVMSTTAGGGMALAMCQESGALGDGAIGGAFYRGWLSVSTNAMPSAIATSDCSKEGSSTNVDSLRHPYILIAA